MRRPLAALATVLCATVLTACAATASSSSFKGAEHEAAQTLTNFQADATADNEHKICANDLAAVVVTRLKGSKRCEAAIKTQLGETDSLELAIESVKVAPDGTSATAQTNGVYRGKKRLQTVTLVKEDGKWKLSGVQ